MSKGMLRVAWVVALMLLVLTLTACSGEDSNSFTPPPATIIRASDEVVSTATPVSAEGVPAATVPMPPTRPAVQMPTKGGTDYPLPYVTPQFTATPVVYPTK